jgi:LmbE family N-acetylglucosaminyl deacetylase
VNVLVIAPHPDDEAIGCGGTIGLHRARGDNVSVTFLTSGELGLKHLPPEEAKRIREAEAQAAARALGIARIDFLRQPDWFLNEHVPAAAKQLSPILRELAPDTIYVPHALEWHPDHQAALPIVRAGLSIAQHTSTLVGYEVWTPLGAFDDVQDITSTMRSKLRAVRCYTSQLEEFRYDRAVRGLNQYRGELGARCRYAEVFQSIATDEAHA